MPPDHIGRCEQVTSARDEAVGLGHGYDVPDVTTADLWAHLGHIAAPPDATRIVRQLLDLGWRPVVGNDKKRLWSAPTHDRAVEREANSGYTGPTRANLAAPGAAGDTSGEEG